MRANYYSEEPKRRRPEGIDDLLGSIIAGAGAGADPGISQLVETWDEVVSDRWNGCSVPIGVKEQVLLVEVPTGAEASILRYDTADLLRRISARFGPDLVRAVRFRVSGDFRGGKP